MEIIDLRNEYSYKIRHLTNSRNISLYKLLANPSDYLNKNTDYLLVCEYGIKSKKVSDILNKMGYHTNSLKGGIKSVK